MDSPTLTLNTTLTTQAFYVLLALTERPLHGYGIVEQAAIDSQSRIIMAPGTIYGILKRLANDKLVLRLDGRYPRYQLTQAGRNRLNAEAGRLKHAALDAQRKLGTFTLPI
jgi:DNA-binding PadR family transcriptional regulator